MPLTLAQIRTTMTRTQCLDSFITVLDSLGFNASSWQSGSIQRTILTGAAEGWSLLTSVADSLSRIVFNADATGDALTEFSDSHYDNQRTAATLTTGYCRLTCSAAAGPYGIVASQLVASDTVNGYTYRNTGAGVLPSGGTLDLVFVAETAGAARNVANGTITTLQTPLAGVTINNPAWGGTGTWITTAAVDAETDATLRTRNTSKWGTLSYASPAAAYENFALAADPDVVRVYVDDSNPGGAGTVYVYCARTSSTATAGDVATVLAYINTKRPCTSAVSVIAATEQMQSVTFTAYITAAKNNAATQGLIAAAVDAYINGLDIGGTYPPGSAVGYAYRSELIGAITAVDGVEGVTLTVPAADVALLSAHHVLVRDAYTATYTSI